MSLLSLAGRLGWLVIPLVGDPVGRQIFLLVGGKDLEKTTMFQHYDSNSLVHCHHVVIMKRNHAKSVERLGGFGINDRDSQTTRDRVRPEIAGIWPLGHRQRAASGRTAAMVNQQQHKCSDQ